MAPMEKVDRADGVNGVHRLGVDSHETACRWAIGDSQDPVRATG